MLEKQVLLGLLILLCPLVAYAYIGPGLGLGTIGVVLGTLGAIILAIFAILWYPLKRLIRRKRSNKESKKEKKSKDPENDGSDSA
jgi:hypothetical protein